MIDLFHRQGNKEQRRTGKRHVHSQGASGGIEKLMLHIHSASSMPTTYKLSYKNLCTSYV